MDNKVKIFNSPIEVGIRTLFILSETNDQTLDLHTLVYFDYFLVHSGDIPNGPDSIHPPSPFRSGEIAVKREILKKSLQILHKKRLVDVKFSNDGIEYKATDSGKDVVNSMKGEYAEAMQSRAYWLTNKFGDMSREQLDKFVSEHIQAWGAEFLKKE